LSQDYRERVTDTHGHGRSGRHWIWNVGFALVFMVVGGAAALVGQSMLTGRSTNEVSIKRYQDWRVVCSPANDKGEGGGCRLEATIARQDGGTLLSLAIDNTEPGSQMSIVVPHGVLLERGLGFSVGDGSLKVFPYETCVPQGCVVLVGLDSETLKAMRSAQAGQVVLVPGNGQALPIPFSLKGFNEGLEGLDDAKGGGSVLGIF
jgi:invasion protein IalB